MKTKDSSKLTLRDRLSRLTFAQACKWLGTDGPRWMRQTVRAEVDPANDVLLDDDTLQITFPGMAVGTVVVTLQRDARGRDGVKWACSESADAEIWCATALTFVLEEKLALGLAAPPEKMNAPWDLLKESELERRALAEREERARQEKMEVAQAAGAKAAGPWCDYIVKSALSGKTYRVALRGLGRGESFCACPDFRKNTLGTCKHLLRVSAWAKKKHTPAELRRAFVPEQLAVHVRYDGDVRLGLELPGKVSAAVQKIAEPWSGRFAVTAEEIAALFSAVTENYHFMKIFHLGAFAVAGMFGVRVLGEGLVKLAPEQRGGIRPLMASWLLLYSLVGAQIGWSLKPFLGSPYLPATPPFRLDRGNVYVSGFQSFSQMTKVRSNSSD